MSRMVYGNFGDFAAIGYGAWYDSVLDIARSVIPSKTVVGKLIGSPPPPPTAVPVPAPGSVAPVGASSLPSWVMPVAIGGGALLLLTMLMPRRR